jgi:hypothetical protein
VSGTDDERGEADMGGARRAQQRRKPGGLQRIITLISIGLSIAAIVKELRLPQAERTWNGTIAAVVPYDFRMPTLARAKERWWNPVAPVIGPRIFGVGWTVNAGRIWALVQEKRATAE